VSYTDSCGACPLGLLCLCTQCAEVWQCKKCGLVVFFRVRNWAATYMAASGRGEHPLVCLFLGEHNFKCKRADEQWDNCVGHARLPEMLPEKHR